MCMHVVCMHRIFPLGLKESLLPLVEGLQADLPSSIGHRGCKVLPAAIVNKIVGIRVYRIIQLLICEKIITIILIYSGCCWLHSRWKSLRFK